MTVRFQSTTLGLFVLTALLLAGCAGPSQDRRPETEPEDQARSRESGVLDRQEYADVYAFAGDDWRESWSPRLPAPARFDITGGSGAGANGRGEDELQMVQGFRVQLADVLSNGDAMRIRDRALELFDHVYVTFRSPNYKVRAGNFQRRAEAARKLDAARAHGFRDAWIVPDWVYVNPPAVDDVEQEEAAADSMGVGVDVE